MITLDNYEQYLYQYAEGMLDDRQSRMVERFLDEHQELKEELSLYVDSPTIERPDVCMPGKRQLKRFLLPMMLWRVAAAACVAVVLMVPLFLHLFNNRSATPSATLADNRTPTPSACVSEAMPAPMPADSVCREERSVREPSLQLRTAAVVSDTAPQYASIPDEPIRDGMEIIEKTNTIIYDTISNETPESFVIITDKLIAYEYSTCDTMEADFLIAYSNLPDLKSQIYNSASGYLELIAFKRSELHNDIIALAEKLNIR